MAEALKTFSFPVGGIANFYLEDHEKEALYKEKAQENFGSDGLGAIQDVAVRMASYGRYGDDKLVHAETGELVVPKALIDKNPKLKDSIFNHLKDMGIEDPERYVVGTGSNSINPETGLPEFFLKDIFDKVGDVIRKVAKPVLTIAGAYFLGPVYGAALGAGIGGLIQGESLEQAFGSALTAGAVGGAGSFLAGGAEGAKAAFTTNPFGDQTKLAQMLSPPKTMTDVTGATKVNVPTEKPTVLDQVKADAKVTQQADSGISDLMKDTRFTNPTTGTNIPVSQPGFTENLRQGNFKEAFFPQKQVTALDVIRENPTMDITEATKLADAASTRGFLSQNVGNIALGTTAAAAGGFFDAPEVEDLADVKTGQDLIDENRAKYIVGNTNVIGSQPPFMIPTRFPFTPTPPVQYAAQGGEAFPRRNGGIDMDEGTPGKDSVRAMLMPGEFVMTTDAVNGAGGGNNEKGIKNMYAMMRSFEAKARA